MNDNPLPIITIIGPTGTGKSKLGVHIAKYLLEKGKQAEVINVDAMQMYKGLPIATNQDQGGSGVKHHMVAFLDPAKGESINVTRFTDEAVALVNDLLAEGTIPILTGGSNYYIQNILMNEHLITETSEEKSSKNNGISFDLESIPPEQWHSLLCRVDPAMGNKYHPNDTRRIKRSLQIYQQEGCRHSDIIKEQQQGLRFTPKSRNLIFWTHCERKVLSQRLNDRVDTMKAKGILKEADLFWKTITATHLISDPETLPTTGIFSAIGFKELHPYLIGKQTADECLDVLKSNTRRYAKQQSQWITNRFVTKDLLIFKMDTTDSENWMSNCGEPAANIIDAYFNKDRTVTLPNLFPQFHQSSSFDNRNAVGVAKLFSCDICHKSLAGEDQYKIHIASRKHRSAAKRKEREPLIEKYKRLKEENTKKS